MNFIQLRIPQEAESDEKLILIVNAVFESEASMHDISIRAELIDYPFAEAGITNFKVNIIAPLDNNKDDSDADSLEVPYYYISPDQEAIDQLREENLAKIGTKPEKAHPVPYIVEVSQDGRIRIFFSEEM